MMMEVMSSEVDEVMAPVSAPKLAGLSDWLNKEPGQLSRQLNGWTKSKMVLPAPKRSGPDFYRNDLYMGPDPMIPDSEDDSEEDEDFKAPNNSEASRVQRRQNILPADGDNWHLDLGCCAAAAAASFGSMDTMASLREGVIARPAFGVGSDSEDEEEEDSSSDHEPETCQEVASASSASAVGAFPQAQCEMFQEYDDEEDEEDEFASYSGFSYSDDMVPFTNVHANILEEEAF